MRSSKKSFISIFAGLAMILGGASSAQAAFLLGHDVDVTWMTQAGAMDPVVPIWSESGGPITDPGSEFPGFFFGTFDVDFGDDWVRVTNISTAPAVFGMEAFNGFRIDFDVTTPDIISIALDSSAGMTGVYYAFPGYPQDPRQVWLQFSGTEMAPGGFVQYNMTQAPAPAPASLALLLSGVLGLTYARRRNSKSGTRVSA